MDLNVVESLWHTLSLSRSRGIDKCRSLVPVLAPPGLLRTQSRGCEIHNALVTRATAWRIKRHLIVQGRGVGVQVWSKSRCDRPITRTLNRTFHSGGLAGFDVAITVCGCAHVYLPADSHTADHRYSAHVYLQLVMLRNDALICGLLIWAGSVYGAPPRSAASTRAEGRRLTGKFLHITGMGAVVLR